jgi:hypothetical protein
MMSKFKAGDEVVFVSNDDWIPYGNKGVVVSEVIHNSYESYIVALVGITPNNLSKKGIECVALNLIHKSEFKDER